METQRKDKPNTVQFRELVVTTFDNAKEKPFEVLVIINARYV